MALRDNFETMIHPGCERRVRVLADVRRQTRLKQSPYGCPVAIAPSECPSRPSAVGCAGCFGERETRVRCDVYFFVVTCQRLVNARELLCNDLRRAANIPE